MGKNRAKKSRKRQKRPANKNKKVPPSDNPNKMAKFKTQSKGRKTSKIPFQFYNKSKNIKNRIPKPSMQSRIEIVKATGKTLAENLKNIVDTTAISLLSVISKNIIPESRDDKIQSTKSIQSGISTESTCSKAKRQ
ncbi:uncharacterized protein LOC129568247 isoform X1 [Sitodiplosis mosellana]|uniref:uncharacterized protein LOC129568247 isoform X1 n=1 Tax=Sitodiplosis mosellana TaxID=263140 RepID=UPI002444F181|nr:uncharacterized protein LOC129568247 isoform X1 [Sitodiplosis mosellana]